MPIPQSFPKEFCLYSHINRNKRKKALIGAWPCYLLILFLIHPLSPFLFDAFLNFKEPNFLPPVSIEGKIPIRSDIFGDGHFGARRSGGRRKHKGLDIKADIGKPVFASKSGVVKTGWVKKGMGKYVKIKHHGNYITIYGHLSKITVENDQWVWQGSKIGEVGKTGNANYKGIQPHLHFEIRYKNKHVDPLGYISNIYDNFSEGGITKRDFAKGRFIERNFTLPIAGLVCIIIWCKY